MLLLSVVKHFIVALKIGYIEHGEAEKLLETVDSLEPNHRSTGSQLAHLFRKIIRQQPFLPSTVSHKSISVHDWRLGCWAVLRWCSSSSEDRGELRRHWGGRGMPLGSVTCPSCRFFTSWASQRLVVVSSFKTWAKVVSLSWSGRHCRRASLALRKDQTQGQECGCSFRFIPAGLSSDTANSALVYKESFTPPGVVREAQVTADNMLQQTSWRLFGELQDHFTLKERTVSQK